MKTAKISAILAVLTAISAFCMADEQKIDLKIRLKAGDDYKMKISQDQNITQTVNGQDMQIKQQQEMTASMKCLSVDANGDMAVEFAYTSMKMVMDGPTGHIEYDSAKPDAADVNNPMTKIMGKMFSAMFGGTFNMMVKPNGQTYNISGVKEMLAKLKDGLKDDPQAEAMSGFFDKFFDEDKVKEMTSNMMLTMPDAPVAVGDSWYDDLNVDLGFPIDVQSTYILKKIDGKTAYIDSVAKMDMGDSAKPMDMGGAKMTMQVAGAINSALQVDTQSGIVKKSETDTNMSGIMKMEANEQMPQGMTIPMKIVGKAVVEMVK